MSGKDLNLLRNQIDKIDKDILKLIQKRANIAIKVGDIKNKNNPGKTLYKPERESSILRNILKSNEGPVSDERIRVIYKELISACLSLEEGLKVGYLGPFHRTCPLGEYLLFSEVNFEVPQARNDISSIPNPSQPKESK